MTEKDIVLETIKHIHKNGRSVEDGDCRYKHFDGRQCAVGRCMDMRKYKRKYEGETLSTFPNEHDYYLKKRYHGHDLIFWNRLQDLHDDDDNWLECSTGTKLSPTGVSTVRGLLGRTDETFTNNEYEEIYS